MKVKFYKILSCALLSVASSMILQAMEEIPEQTLQRAKQEMKKLFPQTKATKFAAQAMTSPAARNEFFSRQILDYIKNKDPQGALDALKRALKQGLDVNYFTYQGGLYVTLLDQAVKSGYINLVRELLNAGANPNIGGFGNGPALFSAIVVPDGSLIMSELIKKGANVNGRSWLGDTPLMQAIRWGSIPAVETLLKVPGIDLMAKSAYGETALDLARENRPELLRLLTPYYMTLKGLGLEAVKKYRGQQIPEEQIKKQLPEELQEEL